MYISREKKRLYLRLPRVPITPHSQSF